MPLPFTSIAFTSIDHHPSLLIFTTKKEAPVDKDAFELQEKFLVVIERLTGRAGVTAEELNSYREKHDQPLSSALLSFQSGMNCPK